jgi:hypothetical protein
MRLIKQEELLKLAVPVDGLISKIAGDGKFQPGGRGVTDGGLNLLFTYWIDGFFKPRQELDLIEALKPKGRVRVIREEIRKLDKETFENFRVLRQVNRKRFHNCKSYEQTQKMFDELQVQPYCLVREVRPGKVGPLNVGGFEKIVWHKPRTPAADEQLNDNVVAARARVSIRLPVPVKVVAG